MSGPGSKLTGNVCLNGDAVYSCQKINFKFNPAPSNPCKVGGTCRVFTTSTAYNGNLVAAAGGGVTGIEAGNLLCQSHADSVPLGGTWRAFLADGQYPPANIGYDASITYEQANSGVTIAGPGVIGNLGGLLSSSFFVTETGGIPPNNEAWTGFNNGLGSLSCINWTSSLVLQDGSLGDNVTLQVSVWSGIGFARGCDQALVLYCFELPT